MAQLLLEPSGGSYGLTAARAQNCGHNRQYGITPEPEPSRNLRRGRWLQHDIKQPLPQGRPGGRHVDREIRVGTELLLLAHYLSLLGERTIGRLYLEIQADPGSLRSRDRFHITCIGQLHLVATSTMRGP